MNFPPAISVTELEARIANLKIFSDIALQQEVLKNLERNKSAAQRRLNVIRDSVARLPLEISSEIFLGCLTSQRKPGAHVAPLLFLNICNAWTDIALSTLALWDTIELDFRSADCLRSWLPRAGRRTLTVALNRGLDHSVAAILGQYATQLKHLTIGEEMDDELSTLAAAVESFPHLDTLLIDCLSDEYGDFEAFHSSAVLELLRLAPNLVELTLGSLQILNNGTHFGPGDQLILSRLTSFKSSELKNAERILPCLITPALDTLVLPYASICDADLSLFLRRSSPPLKKLVLDYKGALGEVLIQIPSSVTHLELNAYGWPHVDNLLRALEDLPSDSLPNLRTLIIKIRGPLIPEPSWYHTLLRFLSRRCTTIAHFDLFQYSYEPPPIVDGDLREGFRRLVDNGMQVWMGTNEHNYLAGWLQQPNGMTFISDYEAFKRDRMRNWFTVDA
ncbi:hypothetical protein B0H16DRAFT_1894530 [Mycena metata]|uniref:F-box domain-containing protein n=1 Tax=Mycena metata TaxID=1033252 RepID=A0AAD7HU57_9AGAR|nr:hypothetical protein B0H16DRAFT_1894530 [Mycena metata]